HRPRPALPPDVPEVFLPVPRSPTAAHYRPMLLGAGVVYITDRKRGVKEKLEPALLAEFAEAPGGVSWQSARPLDVPLSALQSAGAADADYAPLPGDAARGKNYSLWEKSLADWLYHHCRVELFYSPSLKVTGLPGDDERAFRARLHQSAREKRDE